MNVSNTAVRMLVSGVVVLLGFTPGISPGGGGGGVELTVGTSLVAVPVFTPGISPASAVPDRTPTRVIANNTLFMKYLL
jgi:hypothetical protein